MVIYIRQKVFLNVHSDHSFCHNAIATMQVAWNEIMRSLNIFMVSGQSWCSLCTQKSRWKFERRSSISIGSSKFSIDNNVKGDMMKKFLKYEKMFRSKLDIWFLMNRPNSDVVHRSFWLAKHSLVIRDHWKDIDTPQAANKVRIVRNLFETFFTLIIWVVQVIKLFCSTV